ncbi:hypothetical protein SteCoe_19018 [Stentor coeruleus]|uniref:EGF-like domain-containing protein n=1 Tax=Stentor coeruleus TaxID=5963 RepID=A0A1R2BV26_9CILI|nr:hypothetical protein SteCoe_19018 [Stentor coeruleus]
MAWIALLLLFSAQGGKILEYHLGYNFGKIFIDYSNSNNYGINGFEFDVDDKDTKPTDRGAYFDGSSYITAPPNQRVKSGIALNSDLSILMWVRATYNQDMYLTYRKSCDGNQYFYLKRTSNDSKLKFLIKQNNRNSKEEYTSDYTFPISTFYIGTWIFWALKIESNKKFSVYKNSSFLKDVSFDDTYLESGTTSHYIGYTSTSFKGYILTYIVFNDSTENLSIYAPASGTNSCYAETCSLPCTSVYYESNVKFCITDEENPSENGKGNACPTGCTSGCTAAYSSNTCLVCTYFTGSCAFHSSLVYVKSDTSEGIISCSETQYLSNSICNTCDSDCAICESSSTCLVCKADNAYANNSGDCECITGYTSTISPLTTKNACQSSTGTVTCSSQCSACTTSNYCTTCTATNAIAVSGICECIDGYYASPNPPVSINDCKICSTGCKTCSKAIECQTCVANNAIAVSGVCKCKDGYYASPNPPVSISDCKACSTGCKTCEKAIECQTCVANNAIAVSGVCGCINGFYSLIIPPVSINDCKNCNTGCQTCTNAIECQTCVANNAIVTSGVCKCKDGYYSLISPPVGANDCILCNSGCKICTVADKCDTCVAKNTVIRSGVCECMDGYYSVINPPVDVNDCQSCYDGCKTCEEKNICLSCIVNNSEPDLFQGCKCSDGFYSNSIPLTSSSICLECNSECKTCENGISCLTCKTENTEVNLQGLCSCKENFYLSVINNVEECLPCNTTCKTCENSTSCLTCKTANAVPNLNDNACSCPRGYINTTECIKSYFGFSLDVSDGNIITIMFQETLDNDLNTSYVEITHKNTVNVKFVFENSSKNEYNFSTQAIDTIPEGYNIKVNINEENLRSKDGNFFDYKSKSTNLHYMNAIYVSSKTTEAIVNSTKTMTKMFISSSIVSGIVSNPSFAWILINTLQIITYLPLNSISYTKSLTDFFASLNSMSFIPNPFNYIFENSNNYQPYLEARRYGIDTSYFLVNTGPLFANFIFFITLIPIIYLASKIPFGNLALKFSNLLLNYRYSFFLRFWMQSYLDMGLMALIQLRSEKNNTEGLINTGFACVAAILVVLTPPILIVSGYINYLSRSERNHEEFNKKWGSLFAEFKNNKGWFSTQFYTVFCLRRLFYLLSQIYLNSYSYIQNSVNLSSSLIQIAFMVYYLPYKENEIMISTLIGEFCTLEVMVISYFFIPNLGNSKKNTCENLIIYSILATMGIQSCISLISMYKSVKKLCKIIEKARALKFLKHHFSRKKIHPYDNKLENTNSMPNNILTSELKTPQFTNQNLD